MSTRRRRPRRAPIALTLALLTVVVTMAGVHPAVARAQARTAADQAGNPPGTTPDPRTNAARAAGEIQAPAARRTPTAVQTSVQTPTIIRYARPVVHIGQDFTLRADAEARDLIVVLGTLRIEGHVTHDVYVWVGDVHLAPTAVVDGSLIVVAGAATIEPGARLGRDLAVIGGGLDAPPDFVVNGDHVAIGTPELGRGLRGFVPWITRGLLWGRPIVPDLPWVWTVVGILFALSVALTLIFGRAVRASSDVLVQRPLRAFLTGLLTLVVAGPLLILLIMTVVGVVVAPVFLFGLAVVWTVGKVAVARGIGRGVWQESDPGSPVQGLRSLVIGFAAIVLGYMVPVLGIVLWSLIGVFGLGCATIATLAALRREYPPKPPKPRKGARPDQGGGPGGIGTAAAFTAHEPAGDTRTDGRAEPGGAGDTGGTSAAGNADGGSRTEDPGGVGRRADDEAGTGAAFRAGAAGFQAGAVAGAGFPAGAAESPPGGGHTSPVAGLPRASFLDRAAAFALDCILVAIIARLIDLRPDGMFFILLLGYHVAFWAWQGTTLGGIIVGARVVRADGSDFQFVDAIVRGLAGVFSIAAFGLGCFWMLRDPEQQTWHDKIAGTYVVRAARRA
ncbi:MAG: RDD family protein [Vicinamibacterales bacterium]